MFILLSSWLSLFKSSLGSSNECGLASVALIPSQSTWAVSPPVGCHSPNPPSPFIITQPEGWYSFYRPTEGRRLSRPRWFNHPKLVTHPSTNRARRWLTSLIRPTLLTITPCRQQVVRLPWFYLWFEHGRGTSMVIVVWLQRLYHGKTMVRGNFTDMSLVPYVDIKLILSLHW